MQAKSVIIKCLKLVKMYYHLKHRLKKGEEILLSDQEKAMIEASDRRILDAPLLLKQVYEQIYHRDKTQKALADDLGVTERYVRKLHKQMVEYLQSFNEAN